MPQVLALALPALLPAVIGGVGSAISGDSELDKQKELKTLTRTKSGFNVLDDNKNYNASGFGDDLAGNRPNLTLQRKNPYLSRA